MLSHVRRIVPNILERLDEIQSIFSKRKNVNLFLDFDGTLAPIAPTPERARLPAETRLIIDKLSELSSMYIAVISGRSLEDVRDTVGLSGIHYAGNHGLEISGIRKTKIVPNATQVVRGIRKICSDLAAILPAIPGAWIENKGLTASIHYRAVAMPFIPELNRIIGERTSEYTDRGIIRLTRGKKVIEIRPDIEWNKGYAVRWMLKNGAKKRAANIYIGDDVTDEDVFRFLKDDITIKVVHETRIRTDAAYTLQDTTEVRTFLQWLLDQRLTA